MGVVMNKEGCQIVAIVFAALILCALLGVGFNMFMIVRRMGGEG
jgi:hypothetical protein